MVRGERSEKTFFLWMECILMKCAMTCALLALSISLEPIEGSAASGRRDMHRCAYADCVTGGPRVTKISCQSPNGRYSEPAAAENCSGTGRAQ